MDREEILNTLFFGTDKRLEPREPIEVDLVRYTRQGVIAFVTDILDDFELKLEHVYKQGLQDGWEESGEGWNAEYLPNGNTTESVLNGLFNIWRIKYG